MKTAVEWLAEQFDNIVELYPSQFEKVNRAIEQAKEMEKLEKNNYICIKCKCKIDEEMHKVSD